MLLIKWKPHYTCSQRLCQFRTESPSVCKTPAVLFKILADTASMRIAVRSVVHRHNTLSVAPHDGFAIDRTDMQQRLFIIDTHIKRGLIAKALVRFERLNNVTQCRFNGKRKQYALTPLLGTVGLALLNRIPPQAIEGVDFDRSNWGRGYLAHPFPGLTFSPHRVITGASVGARATVWSGEAAPKPRELSMLTKVRYKEARGMGKRSLREVLLISLNRRRQTHPEAL